MNRRAGGERGEPLQGPCGSPPLQGAAPSLPGIPLPVSRLASAPAVPEASRSRLWPAVAALEQHRGMQTPVLDSSLSPPFSPHLVTYSHPCPRPDVLSSLCLAPCKPFPYCTAPTSATRAHQPSVLKASGIHPRHPPWTLVALVADSCGRAACLQCLVCVAAAAGRFSKLFVVRWYLGGKSRPFPEVAEAPLVWPRLTFQGTCPVPTQSS